MRGVNNVIAKTIKIVGCSKGKGYRLSFYWCTVMELETFLFSLIKHLQTFNFPMLRGCLEKIAPWMFSMDQTNYACWLPIFIYDLKSLQSNHPGVYIEKIYNLPKTVYNQQKWKAIFQFGYRSSGQTKE